MQQMQLFQVLILTLKPYFILHNFQYIICLIPRFIKDEAKRLFGPVYLKAIQR